MNKKLLISILGLIAILVLAWYTVFYGPGADMTDRSNQEPNQEEGVMMTPPPREGGGFAKLASNSIYLAEQRPGNMIWVNIVNMDKPGYVVIHELVDGKPGAIIGSSKLLSKATEKNVPVTLSRSVADGEEFIAMLHTEIEGNGFDATIDQPVLDTQGNVLFMFFGVSADASDPLESEVMF